MGDEFLPNGGNTPTPKQLVQLFLGISLAVRWNLDEFKWHLLRIDRLQ
jgi:hypothetical protein